jgi:hypothetical protein
MNNELEFFGLMDASINELENEFYEDELAYLAITSKVELPIRDKLAYILHKNIDKHLFVAREWNRIDLAILDDYNEPRCLMEFKATNTQNGNGGINKGELNHIKQHLRSLMTDLISISNSCDTFFGVFIGAHPTKTIEKLNPAIKNYQRPDRATTEEMLRYYNNTINNFFGNATVRDKPLSIKMYEISAGKYYEIPIKVIIHLLWPKEN